MATTEVVEASGTIEQDPGSHFLPLVRFVTKLLDLVDMKHGRHWFTVKNTDVRFDRGMNGLHYATIFRSNGKLVDMMEFVDFEESSSLVAEAVLPTEEQLVFLYEGEPPHYGDTGDCFTALLTAQIFSRIRDQDKFVHSDELTSFFAEIARGSGYHQTKRFLEVVNDELNMACGRYVEIFGDSGDIESDGHDLYSDGNGRSIHVSKRTIEIFKFVSNPCRMAIRKVEIENSDLFFISTLDHYYPKLDSENRSAKRQRS
jgi:hypothetical protein